MKKRKWGLHKIALAALFTVGNTLIRYPWRQGGQQAALLLPLSAAVSVITVTVLYSLFRWLFRNPLSGCTARRTFVAILSVLLGAYAIFCAWRGCGDYVNFTIQLVLPKGSRVFLTAVFLICAGWLSSLSSRGMDSFSILSFLGISVCILLLFFAGMRYYRWNDAVADLLQWDFDVFGILPTLWSRSVFPLSLLALYFALTVPADGKKALATGTGVGCVLSFFCVAQSVLTFGAAYAAELAHPYAYAVRILSVGQYFFRLEGIAYLVDYLSCLTRSAVCLATVGRLARRFVPRVGKQVSLIVCVALFGFSLFQ